MTALVNIAIMFGFVYFTSLGIKTKIHNRKCKKEQDQQADVEADIHQPKPRTIDGGTIIGHRAPMFMADTLGRL